METKVNKKTEQNEMTKDQAFERLWDHATRFATTTELLRMVSDDKKEYAMIESYGKDKNGHYNYYQFSESFRKWICVRRLQKSEFQIIVHEAIKANDEFIQFDNDGLALTIGKNMICWTLEDFEAFAGHKELVSSYKVIEEFIMSHLDKAQVAQAL